MAFAQLWRLRGFEVRGEFLELGTVHLYTPAERVDELATLTATIAPVAGAVSNLSEATPGVGATWAAPAASAPGFALVWDFGAGMAREVARVELGTLMTERRFPVTASLEYFADGVWVSAGPSMPLQWPGPGVANYALPLDVFFDKVVLLLQGDSAPERGARGAKDASISNAPVVSAGAASISRERARFGSAALKFAGGTSYFALGASTGMAFGSGDFTFEGWHWLATGGGGGTNPVWYYNYVSDYATNSIYYGPHSAYGGRVTLWSPNLSASVPVLLDPELPPVAQWVHYAVNRTGSVFTLYRNGVAVATATASGALTGASVPAGQLGVGDGGAFVGYMDDIRVTKGVGRYPGNFAVPAREFPPGQGEGRHASVLQRRAEAALFTRAAGTLRTLAAQRQQLARDTAYGGRGRIYGTTKTKGTPDAPTKARVILLNQRSKLLVREVWSDPATGYFEFTEIDTNQQFLSFAEDAGGVFRPVAANHLTPEVS